MFKILMGIPEMNEFWESLSTKVKNKIANKDDEILFFKLGKAFYNLLINPKYPGLKSHEIKSLSLRYGIKVWESYIENNIASARRIFWIYGPNKDEITIIGFELHPNRSKSYGKIKLSLLKK